MIFRNMICFAKVESQNLDKMKHFVSGDRYIFPQVMRTERWMGGFYVLHLIMTTFHFDGSTGNHGLTPATSENLKSNIPESFLLNCGLVDKDISAR